MSTWSDRPIPPRDWLAAARDLAIIAVCIVFLALALLALVGAPRGEAPRAAQPATVRASLQGFEQPSPAAAGRGTTAPHR